jgi:hypothetical protein
MRQMGNPMSKARLMTRGFFAVALAVLAWGCSESRTAAPQLNATTGQHPAGWMESHWAEYVKTPDQCRTCHGSTSDPAAAGGVSKVSCFTCHAQGVDHPTGWAVGSQHGRRGAQLAPNATDAKVMAGFAHCAKCHGDTYSGGVASSCKACHAKAPHPDRPWLGNAVALANHDKTDIGNASECAKCHTNGANSTRVPAAPPTTTTPGCYNNTLCHDRNP